MSDYVFRRVTVDDASIEQIAQLLSTVFPKASYSAELLRWQYRDNPSGTIIGWNAVAPDGTLAAHYVVQPIEAAVHGKTERGALSFNTATHPAHQGKGLFTQLGHRTYATAAAEGVRHIVGVANANSTPGFTRKLGFALVGRLHARIGWRIAPREAAPAEYERLWNPQTARWRAAKPGGHYRSVHGALFAAAHQPFVRAMLAGGPLFSDVARAPLGFRPVDLWIGLEPSGAPRGVEIPDRLRPSPLNLIFLDLTEEQRNLERSRVRFRAADFDAY